MSPGFFFSTSTPYLSLLGFIISCCREVFFRCQGRFPPLATPSSQYLDRKKSQGRTVIGQTWSEAHPWAIAMPKSMRSSNWLDLVCTPSLLFGVINILLESHSWCDREAVSQKEEEWCGRWWGWGVSSKQQAVRWHPICWAYSCPVVLVRLCLFLSHSHHCPN